MRAYQIGSKNLPDGFNHSFQILSYEIKDLTRDELRKAYFWFPKNEEEVLEKLDGNGRLNVRDSRPQAAMVWKSLDRGGEVGSKPATSPPIIVDGNHRSTLFLSTRGEPETLKVIIFHVSAREYDYYEELVHDNYLSCVFGHLKLDELKEQHLQTLRKKRDDNWFSTVVLEK